MPTRPRPPSGPSQGRPFGEVLRARRTSKGWTQADLIREMQHVARRQGTPLPTTKSLKAMISRWEQGRHTPDRHNRGLLCKVLELDEKRLENGSEGA
jgi:transcriptional regulator with XRE-family HTH domain